MLLKIASVLTFEKVSHSWFANLIRVDCMALKTLLK